MPPTPVPRSCGVWDVPRAWSWFQGRRSRSQHMPRGRGWRRVPPSQGAGCPPWGWVGVLSALGPNPYSRFGGGTQHHPHTPGGGGARVLRPLGPHPTRARGTPTITLRGDAGKSEEAKGHAGGSRAPQKAWLPIYGKDTLPRAGLAGSHRTKPPRSVQPPSIRPPLSPARTTAVPVPPSQVGPPTRSDSEPEYRPGL